MFADSILSSTTPHPPLIWSFYPERQIYRHVLGNFEAIFKQFYPFRDPKKSSMVFHPPAPTSPGGKKTYSPPIFRSIP